MAGGHYLVCLAAGNVPLLKVPAQGVASGNTSHFRVPAIGLFVAGEVLVSVLKQCNHLLESFCIPFVVRVVQ